MKAEEDEKDINNMIVKVRGPKKEALAAMEAINNMFSETSGSLNSVAIKLTVSTRDGIVIIIQMVLSFVPIYWRIVFHKQFFSHMTQQATECLKVTLVLLDDLSTAPANTRYGITK